MHVEFLCGSVNERIINLEKTVAVSAQKKSFIRDTVLSELDEPAEFPESAMFLYTTASISPLCTQSFVQRKLVLFI
jgi:hypothetical protein